MMVSVVANGVAVFGQIVVSSIGMVAGEYDSSGG
jgi:hypothetical protein